MPRNRDAPHSPPAMRGLCLQPLWFSTSSRLPSFSLLPACHPDRIPCKTVWGGKGAQERQLGGCFQLLSGPLPDFFSIPGTEAHLVEEPSLAASGPTTPGGKPWILDINRPKREKASCWGSAVPCSYTRGFPNPQDFRKKGAPDRPTVRCIAQEASFSLCKTTWLLPRSLHPASNFASGLGIPGTSVIVFCPTTHVQAQGIGHVPTCRRPVISRELCSET